MNREIKFRGKRIDNGEWVYGSYVDSKYRDLHFIYNMISPAVWPVDITTVGEYIGLKNKSETEIHEGDKVAHDGIVSVVEWGGHWNYAGFGLSGKRIDKADWEDAFYWDALNPEWAKDIKVIGNIHEGDQNAD
jgi:uncharacterized phage protein (TIGR01671 family)